MELPHSLLNDIQLERYAMKAVLLLLGELSDQDVEWMRVAGNSEALGAGEVLIREGEKVDALYVVLAGQFIVSISQSIDNPMSQVYAALEGELPQRELAKLSIGEMLGEMAFMDTRPHYTTIQAIENSLVLSIPRHKLMTKLSQDKDFAVRFYRALAAVLTDKLRDTVSRFRYSRGQSLSDAVAYEDELDSHTLESLSLAGARFDWLVKQVHQE
jgi:bacteriocin-type transport-associated protein